MLIPPLSSVVVFLLTAVAGYLVFIAATAVATAFARGARRERAVDGYEALAVSRFTIPVSVIVPVEDEHAPVLDTITALLELNYPEFEVIVVCERLSHAARTRLKEERDLETKEVFYRRSLDTAQVQRFYSTPRDSRLMIVEKTPAGRADALNCGINLARYRYAVAIAPGIAFDPNALLRLLSPALRDPATVLAVTSSIERRPGATPHEAGDTGWTRAAHDYQRLVSLRSWMASCLASYRRNGGLPTRDSIIAWRCDAVLALEGFSRTAADPDVDMLARLQISRHERASGRVVRTSEVFGHAEPTSLGVQALISTRRRRALIESVRTFRNAPASGRDRFTPMMSLVVELLTPAAGVTLLSGSLAAAIAGWVSWTAPLLALVMLSFGTGAVSAAALLVRGGAPDAPVARELRRLLLRTPIEWVLYRPAIVWAQLSARR